MKYACVYLHTFETLREALTGIGEWMHFYNHERWNQSLDYRVPDDVYRELQPQGGDAT